MQGAEEIVGKTDTLHRELDDGEAIRLGLSLCRRGDVLVFACGSSLDVFVEAIRPMDPESAARISAQVG
jgi:cyanophycin synthetase